jgi:predicted MFS family arabinose efflux permease
LCGGVLVENGQKFGTNAKFVNSQWLWYNVSFMLAAVLGGQLIEHLSPVSALHAAAFIVALAPLGAIAATMILVTEDKRSINLKQFKSGFSGLLAAVKNRQIWLVAFFLFLYYFSPGFATPLYYHMTDNLKFSQGYIGILSSINAAGWIVGALLYARFWSEIKLKTLLYVSIAMGVVVSASYLLLFGEVSAALLNFFSGFATMLATVATLTLAADFCPKNSEGFSYAVLMSVTNLTNSLSDISGSYLYEHLFDKRLMPLILVSSAFTGIAFFLVPLLRLGKR